MNKIYENVEESKENVDKGNKELAVAVEKSSNTCLWFIVLATLLLIVFLVWKIFF